MQEPCGRREREKAKREKASEATLLRLRANGLRVGWQGRGGPDYAGSGSLSSRKQDEKQAVINRAA